MTIEKLPGKVKHANQRGDAPRVRLNGGPFVDRATLAILVKWNASGVSYGAIIDRLTRHAVTIGYSPVPRKSKRTAPAKQMPPQSLTPEARWLSPV